MTPNRPPRKRNLLTMYLMIFFIVTTVGASVGWIVQSNDNEKLRVAASKEEQDRKKYFRDSEADYQFDINMAERQKKSVVAFAVEERKNIAKLFNNDPNADLPTIQDQVKQTLELISKPSESPKDGLLTKAESQTGQPVLDALKFLHRELVKARQRNVEVDDKLKEKDNLITAANKTRQEMEKANQDSSAKREERIKTIEEEKKRFEDEKNKTLDDVKQSLEQKIAQMEESERQLRTEITGLTLAVQKKDARIGFLQRRIRELRPEVDPLKLALQADGEIIAVVDNGQRVYVNVGSAERVSLGLTFEVYSLQTGLTPDGKGKASIEVMSLDKHTAECRVLRTTPGDPILVGDLISNVVYDRYRTFGFAILGDFDLNQTGSPSTSDMEKVMAWIKLWGGKISEQTVDSKTMPVVNESTDFVVLGAEPKRPDKLSDSPTPEEKKRYDDQLRRFEDFQNLKAEAKALNIAILSQNQFLNYIGKPVMYSAKLTSGLDPFLQKEIEAGKTEGAGGGTP